MNLSMKSLVFFIFLFSILTFLSNILDKEESYLVTELTAQVSETDLVFDVTEDSTTRWPDSAYFWVENEYIKYDSKTSSTFVVTDGNRGLTYGNIETTAVIHASGSLVKAPEADLLNLLLGYNTVVVTTNVGDLATILISDPAILLKALWKMIIWDYSFLTGGLGIIKYLILYPISAGFIITFAMVFAQWIKYMLKLI